MPHLIGLSGLRVLSWKCPLLTAFFLFFLFSPKLTFLLERVILGFWIFLLDWAEGPACADPGARTPIGASGHFPYPVWTLHPFILSSKTFYPVVEKVFQAQFKPAIAKQALPDFPLLSLLYITKHLACLPSLWFQVGKKWMQISREINFPEWVVGLIWLKWS